MNQKNLRQYDTLVKHYLDTVIHATHEIRILLFCINVFQGQIKHFINIWNCLNNLVVFFPVFPTLGVQNLFFPGRYLPVNTAVKTGYRPKPSNPGVNQFKEQPSEQLLGINCFTVWMFRGGIILSVPQEEDLLGWGLWWDWGSSIFTILCCILI